MTDLDAVWPPRGPCGICGGPDARHRIFDAIRSPARSGEREEWVAEDYGVTVEDVRLVAGGGDLRGEGDR